MLVHQRVCKKKGFDGYHLTKQAYRMGPPSDVCGFINHEISPII